MFFVFLGGYDVRSLIREWQCRSHCYSISIGNERGNVVAYGDIFATAVQTGIRELLGFERVGSAADVAVVGDGHGS